MMRSPYAIEVRLVVAGPVSTRSSRPAGFGLDAPMEVDHFGYYCLPASHVKGKLRESFRALEDLLPGFMPEPELKQLLGSESDASYRPARAAILLSDLSSGLKRGGADRLYRIKIDEATGSVERGAFLVTESPWKPGETAEFRGRWLLYSESDEAASTTACKIAQALAFVPAFGSQKTVGFGRPLECSATAMALKTERSAAPAYSGKSRYVELKPRSGICVGSARRGDNSFEGSEVISGSVIRGCIATMLALREGWNAGDRISEQSAAATDPLIAHFEHIIFRHAFPTLSEHFGPRAMHPGFDMVELGNGSFQRDPSYGGKEKVPSFEPDWKDSSGLFKSLGWATGLTRRISVRTAIEDSTKTAKENALFSYEEVLPNLNFSWRARIDLPDSLTEAQRAAVWASLEDLLSAGLLFLGKTDAAADIGWIESPDSPAAKTMRGKRLRAVLQSDTSIIDPLKAYDIHTAEELRAAYQSFWGEQGFRLIDYFVRQDMLGRAYIRGRYASGTSLYAPYIVERAGSTFVLEADRDGMPLPDFLRPPSWVPKDPWSYPLAPNNGFGEVHFDEAEV